MFFQTLSNELHPLLVQKTKNASYVLRYKNKWVDGVSKRISSETVGRILDESTGAFEFSEKFLNKNPQFRGLSFYWDKEHCILTYRDAPDLGPTTQSRLNAGASYLFLEIAEQAGILEDLKTVWGEKAADIISLAIYFLVHPHLNIDSYTEAETLPKKASTTLKNDVPGGEPDVRNVLYMPKFLLFI